MSRHQQKRMDTWFCTDCAKEGRPFTYVAKKEQVCPFGHKRKAIGLSRSPLGRKEQ